ncbi:inositol monophosphatase [Salinarchaeum sp. Harcht-Bsk1]|uniref:inositol monophosphatase family protein n=1 Tax=Salinarchaeum sp. Harcht-Bsk1 TaxID=1333523 RepID=UPI0009DBAF63|nr:inositol monophosphatase [Salinarchaeum sp. Harcht-Bsk1]
MTSDPAERLAVAREAATAGGERALQDFRGDVAVETKSGPTDYVTEADRAAQRTVVETIRDSFPDDPIVGEEDETPNSVPESGPAWVIDPIDGTANYVRGMHCWTTAVAAVEDGEPVAAVIAAPALGDLYAAGEDGATRNGDRISVASRSDPQEAAVCPTLWWSRDRREEFGAVADAVVRSFGDCRRIGSAQYELALVADGALDATIANVFASPWDTIAGAHVVRQAGGRVTDVEGERWRHDARGIVASSGEIHDEALEATQAGDGARQ